MTLVECNTIYPCSDSNQYADLRKKSRKSRKLEAELFKIVTENRRVYKFLDFDMRNLYLDLNGPPSMEYDVTYPHSGLIQHDFHHHFQENEQLSYQK